MPGHGEDPWCSFKNIVYYLASIMLALATCWKLQAAGTAPRGALATGRASGSDGGQVVGQVAGVEPRPPISVASGHPNSVRTLAKFSAGNRGAVPTGGCHFTHVYSPFHTRSKADAAEFARVEVSWQLAASAAAKGGKVSVTFAGLALPRDKGAVKAFARHVPITSYVLDGLNRTLPTIGTMLRLGQRVAPAGGHVVFTNWDIFVVPSFYSDVCQMLQDAGKTSDWQALDITRAEVHPASGGKAGEVSLARLGTAPQKLIDEGVVRTLLPHAGHDCFVIPAELDISCFTKDPGFMVG